MKKYFSLLSIVFILCSCERVKWFPSQTLRLSDYQHKCYCKLYVETYHTGLISTYLTDSTNFRIFTGSYDEEDGFINFQCVDSNTIVVEKKNHDPKYVSGYGKLIIVEKKIYSLKKLKVEHKFD